MKRIIIIFYMFNFILLSCGSNKNLTINNIKVTPCIENIEFKEKFFKCIDVVDNFMLYGESSEDYHNSLVFLSKYAHVSWDKMTNYTKNYSLPAYKSDRKGWVLWYKENKCTLQQSL